MCANVSLQSIKSIGAVLNDTTIAISKRFRALFTLRNINNNESIDEISSALRNDSSALLKHECAYCLGQMRNSYANIVLIEVLSNTDEHPMVRHEAGEALAAIGSQQSLPVLKKFVNDSYQEVAETCLLAVNRLQWLAEESGDDSNGSSAFTSTDPAPPLKETDIPKLKSTLTDKSIDMFTRYRAMFALRNLNNNESAMAIADALNCTDSALFRHEVAYVLGQMQNHVTVPNLAAVLENPLEYEMVRHECAEALGAIATDEANDILKKYANDSQRVVRESIFVALDMSDHYSSDEFQYANGLINTNVI